MDRRVVRAAAAAAAANKRVGGLFRRLHSVGLLLLQLIDLALQIHHQVLQCFHPGLHRVEQILGGGDMLGQSDLALLVELAARSEGLLRSLDRGSEQFSREIRVHDGWSRGHGRVGRCGALVRHPVHRRHGWREGEVGLRGTGRAMVQTTGLDC